MSKKTSILLGVASVAILAATPASATTITAIAVGDVPGTTAIFPAGVVSGDFTYSGNALAPIGGDGIDDQVLWSFNFAGDPDFPTFSGPIAQARFRITLIPRDSLIFTDAFSIIGLPLSIAPDIPPLALNVAQTLEFELLDFYTSDLLLGALSGSGGILNFQYNDDAHVTFAQLDLTSVPEPSVILLLGVGLAALAGQRRRK